MSAFKNPVLPQADDSLYDTDFFEWTQAVSEKLRQGTISRADVENVAEEIADMGKSERIGVQSRLIVLIAHLIKWAIQPERRESSTWRSTIIEQRIRLELAFEDSPGLHMYAAKVLQRAYAKACDWALQETGVRVRLQKECPYTLEQILDDRWLPPDQ